MNETTGHFLLRVWPYLALVLAAASFAVRLLLTGDRLPALSRALARPRPTSGRGRARAWLAVWLLLAGAHAIGLLFPRAVLAWTRTSWHVTVLELVGFAIGLGALAACVRSVWLHLRRPARDGWALLADLADSMFLSFAFIAVASGLLAALFHRWGSQWAAVTVAPYAASLLHGRPVPAFVSHLPLLVRLHLFASFALCACFPATRLALRPLALAHRGFAALGRAGRAAAAPVRAWVQSGPAARIWPDAEVRWLGATRAESPDAVRKPVGGRAAWLPQLARDPDAAPKHSGGKTV
jgi:nitrate reductase gamma subunit